MREYKNKLLMLLSIIFFINIGSVSALDLNPGSCVTVPTYITTDINDLASYTFYNVTVCAVETPCSVDLTLGPGETYENTTGSCDIHVTTVAAELCEITETLESNASYKNENGVCRVDITTETRVCPSCPDDTPETCELTETIHPNVGNVTIFENTTGSCNVKLTVDSCPTCEEFQMPTNYSLIHNDRIAKMTAAAELGVMAAQDTVNCNSNLSSCYNILWDLEDDVRYSCKLSEKQLITGWEGLSNMARERLPKFARLNASVTMWEFSAVIDPLSEQPEESAWYASWILEEYVRVGFAEAHCNQVYYEKYNVNMTECSYEPLIVTSCINLTKTLVDIKDDGNVVGKTEASTILITGIVAFLLVMFILARLNVMPWR